MVRNRDYRNEHASLAAQDVDIADAYGVGLAPENVELLGEYPNYYEFEIGIPTSYGPVKRYKIRAFKPSGTSNTIVKSGNWTVFSGSFSAKNLTLDGELVDFSQSYDQHISYARHRLDVGKMLEFTIPAAINPHALTTIQLAICKDEIVDGPSAVMTNPNLESGYQLKTALSNGLYTSNTPGTWDAPYGDNFRFPPSTQMRVVRRQEGMLEYYHKKDGTWRFWTMKSINPLYGNLNVLLMQVAVTPRNQQNTPLIYMNVEVKDIALDLPLLTNDGVEYLVLPWTTNNEAGWMINQVTPNMDFFIRIKRLSTVPLHVNTTANLYFYPYSMGLDANARITPANNAVTLTTDTDVIYVPVKAGSARHVGTISSRQMKIMLEESTGIRFTRDTYDEEVVVWEPQVDEYYPEPLLANIGQNTIQKGVAKSFAIDYDAYHPAINCSVELLNGIDAVASFSSFTDEADLALGRYGRLKLDLLVDEETDAEFVQFRLHIGSAVSGIQSIQIVP